MEEMLSSKNEAILYSKNGSQPRKSKVIFSTLKLYIKRCLVPRHHFKRFFVDQCKS